MRKELYKMLCDKLKTVSDGAIKHIDLWNHNVEFIEQEEQWERPAVFVEFAPIQWTAIQPGVEYLKVFDLLEEIHKALTCLEGATFMEFDLVESRTSHNHEEIIENIESYRCVAIKSL